MDQAILLQAFETAMVRSCAPVLLRAKPANLFTFRGNFVSDCPDCPEERCRLFDAPAGEDDLFASRRRALLQVVSAFDGMLASEGMRCRVIAWRPFGALVYAYRPSLVARHVSDSSIARDLARLGYPVFCEERCEGEATTVGFCSELSDQGFAEDCMSLCIDHLAIRFCEHAVPHEVGYFLGYPAADVRGFIEHEGRGFLCFGCWKVYGDVRWAQYRFARYKRCTRRARALYEAGASLLDLACEPGSGRAAYMA